MKNSVDQKKLERFVITARYSGLFPTPGPVQACLLGEAGGWPTTERPSC